MKVLALLCFVATAAGAHEPVATALGPAFDLTHPFDADTIYWPTEEGFTLERGRAVATGSCAPAAVATKHRRASALIGRPPRD